MHAAPLRSAQLSQFEPIAGELVHRAAPIGAIICQCLFFLAHTGAIFVAAMTVSLVCSIVSALHLTGSKVIPVMAEAPSQTERYPMK